MPKPRAAMGHGWPFVGGPPRSGPRSDDGVRGVERSMTGTPSSGWRGTDFLVPLGGAGHPALAKRDSP